MSNPNYRWPDLIDKYLTGQITDIEMQELNRQKTETSWKQEQFESFATMPGIMKQVEELEKTDLDANWEALKGQLHFLEASKKVRQAKIKMLTIRLVAAVVIGVIIAGGIYLYLQQRHGSSIDSLPAVAMKNIYLGREALFIAEDGTEIKLDSIQDGSRIASNIPYIKKNAWIFPDTMAHSRVIPETGTVHQAAYRKKNSVYTLYVPAGRQYRLTLPDRSSIKINAASSLYFPVDFSGNYRWVGLKGEAYFEVAKNENRPFYINVNNKMCAEVFGTILNITGYDDMESITTTLIEGRINIARLDTTYRIINSLNLRSGQQANLKNGQFIITDVDNTTRIIDWTNGKFNFEKKSITEIMLEISRWYSVKIQYNGEMPGMTSSAVIPRSLPLSGMIKILEKINQIDITETPDSVLIVSPQLQTMNTSD